MIDGQKKVIRFCEEIAEKAKEADIADIREKVLLLKDAAHEQELIVPVVGGFSSGKSTLINNIISADILPVGITPETSLATELHYSPEEYIEAVKKDGNSDRYKVDEITTLKDKAADYKYSKLYLKNDIIKNIEPLVLVDMPGFDSPLDQHNKAINEYLDRGCHYIVLSSVEDGTVSKSLLHRLQFIDELGRGFSFFLSKANLRPEKTVAELIDHYQKTIRDNLEIDTVVAPLGNISGKNVVQKLQGMDINKLFFSLFRIQLAELCHDFLNFLNVRINASRASLESNAGLIKEMEESVEKIQKKSDELVADIQSRYSGSMIANIIDNDISRELDSLLDELVEVAIAGNHDRTARLLNEVINDTLVISVKNKLQGINEQITLEFSSEIISLDRVMKNYTIDDDFANGLATSVQAMFGILQSLTEKIEDPGFEGKWAGITGVLAAVTSFVHPAMEAVIIILPIILKPIFVATRKEQVRQKFLTEVFPEIKRKLRAELTKELDGQIKVMIEQVRAQYEKKIKLQQAEIEKTIEMRQSDAEAVQKQLAGIEGIRDAVQIIANEIIREK
jgi:hypothetical protein